MLVFDGHKFVDEVPGLPGTYHVHTEWRGDTIVGFVLKGERDQVMATFDAALRDQYVREVRYFAEIMVDRQPKGGPRM